MNENFKDLALQSFLSPLNELDNEGCKKFCQLLSRKDITDIGFTQHSLGYNYIAEDVDNNVPFVYKEEDIQSEILFSKLADELLSEGIQLGKNNAYAFRFREHRMIITTGETGEIVNLEIH